MKTDVRIAAVVCRCPSGLVKHNLSRTRYWARQAKDKGATIVCFPELNLTGYSNRLDIADHAIRADGPETRVLVRLAEELGLILLVGFAEKDTQERLFATHMVAAPNGRTDFYRKVHLAPPEKDRFSPGNHVPVFQWSGIRFGIQLCYDAHFPELTTRMAKASADMIFIPHASPRGLAADKHQSWMRHLPARAFDNGLFIIACNQCGNNENGLTFPGNAVVFSPSGEIIDARLSGESGMLITDLAADRIDHVRNHRMRYFFPNRRPELYRKKPRLMDLDE